MKSFLDKIKNYRRTFFDLIGWPGDILVFFALLVLSPGYV